MPKNGIVAPNRTMLATRVDPNSLATLSTFNTTLCGSLLISAITSDFDRLFELAWKTMKEYMYKNLGMQAAKTGSPKEILSLAHNQGIIKDGAVWLEMLQNRNDDAHIYRLSVAVIYKSKIEEVYLGYMKELIDYFKDVIPDEQIQAAKVSEDLLEESKIKGVPLWELAVKEAKKQDAIKKIRCHYVKQQIDEFDYFSKKAEADTLLIEMNQREKEFDDERPLLSR